MITVRLDIPDDWVSRARYAFQSLALRWGIPLRFARDGEPHFSYTADPSSCPDATCAILFDPAMYEARTVCRAVNTGGRWTWCRADLPDGMAPDFVGGAFRLLTYSDESQVPEERRDRRGIFLTDALPPERARVAAQPLVEQHAAILLEALLTRHPGFERLRIRRWPGGRRMALALSHDVDAADLAAPFELAANLAKGVLRRNRDHMKAFGIGIASLAERPGPYFGFPRWRDWERERGLQSAFYVFFRPRGVPRDFNDCKSSLASRRTDWETLRRMAAEGWEFGLHPAIHAKDSPGGFERSKAWLESRLGRSVAGLRHHYWALDWRNPASTHRQHQQAGFRYDSSIAWRDRPGFRAGTALPYHPFDPTVGKALDLVEIPCALMDGHILLSGTGEARRDPEAALRMGRDIVDRVREVGGVLVTNWHQEGAFDRLHFRGYMDLLDRLLEPLRCSSDVWVATPQEVCAHWRRLASDLLGAAGDAA